ARSESWVEWGTAGTVWARPRCGRGAALGETSNRPPCSSAIVCTSARPRPVPSARVVKNGSATPQRSSGAVARAPAQRGRDARPAVVDVEAHLAARAATADVHGPALRLRLERVGHEVAQGLAQLDAVAGEGRASGGAGDAPQRGVAAGRQRAARELDRAGQQLVG